MRLGAFQLSMSEEHSKRQKVAPLAECAPHASNQRSMIDYSIFIALMIDFRGKIRLLWIPTRFKITLD